MMVTVAEKRKQSERNQHLNWLAEKFEDRSDSWLREQIWNCNHSMVPVMGLPEADYRDELERRTGSRKGYHEE